MDVLTSRRSMITGSIGWVRIAELLWHAASTKGYGSVGRAGLPIEWRASPSAGGLHPIQVVCIPEHYEDGVRLYDAMAHAFLTLDVDAERIVAVNAQEIRDVVGASRGCTLRLIADTGKIEAAYENSLSLVLRDAGCLIATFCLCAEWLGVSACPLGIMGQALVPALGYPEPRFHAVGAIQITQP